jgi:methylaspartate mutase sigma subunit
MSFSITKAQSSLSDRSAAKNVVLSSVSSDSHTWNLIFLQLLLESMGHHVTNLGACTPDEDVVEACKRSSPDLLVISTINGHGHIDGERLIRRIRSEPELRDLRAVIGGKLGTRGAENIGYSKGLLDAGFDLVFESSSSSIDEFVNRVSSNTKALQVLEVNQ